LSDPAHEFLVSHVTLQEILNNPWSWQAADLWCLRKRRLWPRTFPLITLDPEIRDYAMPTIW